MNVPPLCTVTGPPMIPLPPKVPPRRLVCVQHFQVAADDDARAAQFAQHVGHHLVVAGELVVQPDVAEREADLFE